MGMTDAEIFHILNVLESAGTTFERNEDAVEVQYPDEYLKGLWGTWIFRHFYDVRLALRLREFYQGQRQRDLVKANA